MKFIMKIQQNTIKARGATSLRLCGIVNHTFGLAVDHFNQHFHSGLKTAGHTGGGHTSGAPQHKTHQGTQQRTHHNGVDVDDRKIDDEPLLVVRQMGQVVTDVFTRGRTDTFYCHVRLANHPFTLERLVWIKNPNQYTFKVTTSPAKRPSQLSSGTTLRRQPHHGHRQQDFHPFPQQEAGKSGLRKPGQQPGQRAGRQTIGHQGRRQRPPPQTHRRTDQATGVRCVNNHASTARPPARPTPALPPDRQMEISG